MVDPLLFVREFLADFYEHRFICGLLPQDTFFLCQAALMTPELERCAVALFENSPYPVEVPQAGAMRLIYLREIDGTKFPFLLSDMRRGSRNPIRCFVGHRFIKEVEGPLRFNLQHVLSPYEIQMSWSAQDLSASDVFQEIVKSIRSADMCIFDNRDTADRPNVYIEVGIAYALGIPTILTEYVGEAHATIPSDLQGLFRIQYSTYQDLFRKLHFGLPSFISKNQVRRRPPRGRS